MFYSSPETWMHVTQLQCRYWYCILRNVVKRTPSSVNKMVLPIYLFIFIASIFTKKNYCIYSLSKLSGLIML